MESKNILGVVFLGLIILTFVIGGYFLMDYMTKEEVKKPQEEEKTEEVIDLRYDKTKDYIYYENGKEIIEEEEIHQDEANFNFTTLTNLNKELKKETDALYSDIKYMRDVEIPEDTSYNENSEGIYSLKYRHYDNIKFNDYVSLVAVDFDYDVIKGSVPFALKSYVVDIKTGSVLSEVELLNKYNLSMDKVKEGIKKRLSDTQVLGEDDNVIIDIDGTMNDLKYTLYIGKTGKLTASFIVKSNQINYNDIVELN